MKKKEKNEKVPSDKKLLEIAGFMLQESDDIIAGLQEGLDNLNEAYVELEGVCEAQDARLRDSMERITSLESNIKSRDLYVTFCRDALERVKADRKELQLAINKRDEEINTMTKSKEFWKQCCTENSKKMLESVEVMMATRTQNFGLWASLILCLIAAIVAWGVTIWC